MKIDIFDNTLVCEKEDLQSVLTYFKEDRKIPEYIEKSILKIVLNKLYNRVSEVEDIVYEYDIECYYKYYGKYDYEYDGEYYGKYDCGYDSEYDGKYDDEYDDKYGIDDEHHTIDKYLKRLPCEFINNAINDINTMFFTGSKVVYKGRYLSYLMYYLPANIFKVWKPLLDLQLANTLKPDLRVLDIGTGPGSVPLGMIEYYKALAESFTDISFSLSFVLVEAEKEFLDIARSMLTMTKRHMPNNLTINIEKTIWTKMDTKSECRYIGKFDVITMSNFLTANEGDNQENAYLIVRKFAENLTTDGSLIIIEPGEENSCIALKKLRNDIANAGELNVFSPCIGIWEEKSSYQCACFNMVRCYWQVPIIYKYLIDKGLDKARRIDVPFNYVVFRRDKVKKYSAEKNIQHFTKIVDLKEKHNQMVNVIAFIRTVIYTGNKVSFSLCDGSCSFSEDGQAVWIYVSKKLLEQNGITIPLIAAEKITLKKVVVKLVGQGIILELNKNSRIAIDY